MFPPKKKPPFGSPKGAPPSKKGGLDVMIAVGKPKKPGEEDDGLDAPEPPEGKPKEPESSDEEAAEGPGAEQSEHEAGETPGYENAEEMGAKLIQDIDSAGKMIGLQPEESRAFAAELFTAMAECLKGGSGPGGGSSGEPADMGEGAY